MSGKHLGFFPRHSVGEDQLLYTVVVSSTKRSHLKLNLVAVLDFSITSHELHQHIEVASYQLNVAVEIQIFRSNSLLCSIKSLGKEV